MTKKKRSRRIGRKKLKKAKNEKAAEAVGDTDKRTKADHKEWDEYVEYFAVLKTSAGVKKTSDCRTAGHAWTEFFMLFHAYRVRNDWESSVMAQKIVPELIMVATIVLEVGIFEYDPTIVKVIQEEIKDGRRLLANLNKLVALQTAKHRELVVRLEGYFFKEIGPSEDINGNAVHLSTTEYTKVLVRPQLVALDPPNKPSTNLCTTCGKDCHQTQSYFYCRPCHKHFVCSEECGIPHNCKIRKPRGFCRCGNDAPFWCGRCYQETYCGSTCQSKDWETHKKRCKRHSTDQKE